MLMALGAFLLHQTLRGTAASEDLSLWSVALAGTWGLGAIFLISSTSSRRPREHRTTALRHPLLSALIIGALFAAVSLCGALVLTAFPLFGDDVAYATGRVTDNPTLVFLVALITGATEELFFRVGLFRLIPGRWALLTSTLLYGAVTLASGNLALTIAALLLGAVSGFTLVSTARWYAPLIVHGLWTVALVGILPQL